MIIDHSDDMSKTQMSTANPPPYEVATGSTSAPGKSDAPKPREQPTKQPEPSAYAYGSSPYEGPPRSPPAVPVYHYQNPATGEVVTSCLPPNHPEMICLQEGGHVPTTKYGVLGVLAAIFWFPFGIALCCLDRRVYCRRCGHVIEDSFSC